MRPQSLFRHQRLALVSSFLAIVSNAISVRTSPSNSGSGTMFGPSEAA